MNPKVTVVIPCHNHQAWIGQAINSVVAQKYANKQIIVIDDGSTDKSNGEVLRGLEELKVQSSLPNPCIITGKLEGVPITSVRFQKASGPAFARNVGVQKMWEQTDVFMFLDSDDLYMPGKIEKSVQKWQEAPNHIGVVYTDYDTYSPTTSLRIRHYKEPFSRERLFQECLPNMNSLISKEAFGQVGLFDIELRTCEDYDMWIRIAEKFILVHLPEPLVTLRVGEHSSSATVSGEVWKKNWNKVMTKAKARMMNV